MENFKAGDKFIFNKCKKNKELIIGECESSNYTIGKIYTLYDSFGSLSFDDNEADERDFDFTKNVGFKLTKIVD